MAVLTVSDLRIAFGNHPAVEGISFAVEKGEILAIVGESGSGKSVTALSLLGLLPRSARVSGNLTWGTHPENLLDQSTRQWEQFRGRRIGMIFQEPTSALNPVMRCGDQVGEVLRRHRGLDADAARKVALEWLTRVQLPEPERMFVAFPHELSGGQQQRVMIAIALAGEPDLLIADEPTTALDVLVQKRILALIRELQAELELAVLFISHDLAVVSELADRVLVMQKGQIVEAGPAAEIFTAPRHPYTQGLLACLPPLKVRLQRLPELKDFYRPEAESRDFRAFMKEWADVQTYFATEKNGQVLLEAEDLKTYFRSRKKGGSQVVRAVDGVSFRLFQGESLGLVGASGCGKTTLGRSLLRLVEPADGRIVFAGRDIRNVGPAEWRTLRAGMQIIFQDPVSALNPRKPVGDAIQEPLLVHRKYRSKAERKRKVMEMLEKVGLSTEHYYRYPHEFSGGQRQRICIARALILEPRLLICDEAVSALDVSVQAQVLNLLRSIQEEQGLSFLFITHDLSVVRFICDRVLVMDAGRIVESGETDTLFSRPRTPQTRALLEAVPGGRT